jgi:hypothetical protein
VGGHFRSPFWAPGSGQIAQQKSTLWIGINLNYQAVTTVWRTKAGTMLSIGLDCSTTALTAYFRCLALLSECLKREPDTQFLFRMEPHRGTFALQMGG